MSFKFVFTGAEGVKVQEADQGGEERKLDAENRLHALRLGAGFLHHGRRLVQRTRIRIRIRRNFEPTMLPIPPSTPRNGETRRRRRRPIGRSKRVSRLGRRRPRLHQQLGHFEGDVEDVRHRGDPQHAHL